MSTGVPLPRPHQVKANFTMLDPARYDESDHMQYQTDGDHLSGNDILSPASTQDNQSKETTSMKVILYYTPVFDQTHYFGEGEELFKNCPVHQCYGTNNHTLLPSISDFDAILFHFFDMLKMSMNDLVNHMQKHRSPHQRYILIDLESPRHPTFNQKYEDLNGETSSFIQACRPHCRMCTVYK